MKPILATLLITGLATAIHAETDIVAPPKAEVPLGFEEPSLMSSSSIPEQSIAILGALGMLMLLRRGRRNG